MDVVGSLFSVLSFLAAIVITVIVQRAAKRSSAELTEISKQLQYIARGSRRDEIYRQLQESRDPGLLNLLVIEGRSISTDYERVALEKYYHANPSSPLIAYASSLPSDLSPEASREVVLACLDSLTARYATTEYRPPSFSEDMAGLTRACLDLKVPPYPVSLLVASRAQEGWRIYHGIVRDILAPLIGWSGRASNIEAAADYLYTLRWNTPRVAFVNILAGVSMAIIDCKGQASQPHVGYPIESAFASLLRDAPEQLRKEDNERDMTVSVAECIALMVYAIGVVARDPHLTKRCLEGTTAVLNAFEGYFRPNGMITEALRAGITLLTSKSRDNDQSVRRDFLQAAERSLPGLDVD